MSPIPKPSAVEELAPLSAALDAATHDDRVAWGRSLPGREQYKLYELARGSRLEVGDLTAADGEVVITWGRNGMGLFNRFQKRFVLQGDEVAGYNENAEIAPGLIQPIVAWVTGPGHFVAYDGPDDSGEVWIDYRKIPQRQHPEFPPLVDNDHGLRSLVFGNMVDIVRRVSQHVFIGDATKSLPTPEGTTLTLGCKLGRLFPTAPFVICREPG